MRENSDTCSIFNRVHAVVCSALDVRVRAFTFCQTRNGSSSRLRSQSTFNSSRQSMAASDTKLFFHHAQTDRQTNAPQTPLACVGRGRSVGKREGIASEKNSEKRSVEFGTSDSKAPKLKIPAANSPDPAAVAAIPPLATREHPAQLSPASPSVCLSVSQFFLFSTTA